MNAFSFNRNFRVARTATGISRATFNHARPITEDEMRTYAPSIFAVEKHESRSDRFQPIPTIEILRGLMAEGFMPVSCHQSRTRDVSKRDFTKHIVRMRRFDDARNIQVGDNVFEMILKNANDGTAAYDLMGGVFRIRCLNGMVSQIGESDTIKVRHTGTADAIQAKVIDGTYRVLSNSEIIMAAPQDWSTASLSRDESMILAESAAMLRFGEPEVNEHGQRVGLSVDPRQLLAPRRSEDRTNDLWTTFNVIQENVIKGGLRGVTVNADTLARRRQTTREVTGVDQDTKLNRALWVLGQRMAELKGVARAPEPVAA